MRTRNQYPTAASALNGAIPATSTGMEEFDELIRAHIKESIEVDSPESELLECSLLRLHRLDFCIYIRLQTKKRKKKPQNKTPSVNILKQK
jgi:hypothetical protein